VTVPPMLRALLASPELLRALRALLPELGAGGVAVVAAPGVPVPELLHGAPALALDDGARVVVAPLDVARALATARAPSAARALDVPPAARCVRVLLLAPGGGVVVAALPVLPPVEALPAGDA
jgi:hypothetical protein